MPVGGNGLASGWQGRLGLVLVGLLVPMLAGAESIAGPWYTEDDESIVVITKDADSGTYRGCVVWLAETHYTESEEDASLHGTPKRDLNNPDEARRSDPIIGLCVLNGFTARADRWEGGKVYDPNNGKTYTCTLRLNDRGGLVVRGYVGIPALGRSTVWRRVPQEEAEELLETEDP